AFGACHRMTWRGEHGRQMRVAVQAHAGRGRVHRAAGLGPIEDVVVLIERRAVADLDVLADAERTAGQAGDDGQLRRCEGASRPLDGLARDIVEERRRLEARAHLVVIAANEADRLERGYALGVGAPASATPHQPTEAQRRIGAYNTRISQAVLER